MKNFRNYKVEKGQCFLDGRNTSFDPKNIVYYIKDRGIFCNYLISLYVSPIQLPELHKELVEEFNNQL